jgi:hypothetical protein
MPKKPYKNLPCLSLFVHQERLLATPAVLLSADSHGFA